MVTAASKCLDFFECILFMIADKKFQAEGQMNSLYRSRREREKEKEISDGTPPHKR